MSSLLYSENLTGLDLSAGATVLTYVYDGTTRKEVIARVDLGAVGGLLSGAGGAYFLEFLLNGINTIPKSDLVAAAGLTRAIAVSRPVPINPGDTVEIRITGQAGDTNCSTVAELRDATPLRGEEVIGSGEVIVDHNYPSSDAMRVLGSQGQSLDGVRITAYLASDYNSGARGPSFIRGQTTTDANGRWRSPLMLQPESYVLLATRSGYTATLISLGVT